MKVRTINVIHYIIDNPDHNIIITDSTGALVRLEADEEQETLFIKNVTADGIYVDDTQIEINLQRDEQSFRILVDLPLEEHKLIAVHALNKMVQGELKNLLPAAKDMLNHYNTLFRSIVGIDLFVLRDLAYNQPGKGLAVMYVNGYGDQTEHSIRGYVAPHDKDTINFENLQAWRYAKVAPSGDHTSEFSRAVYHTLPEETKLQLGFDSM